MPPKKATQATKPAPKGKKTPKTDVKADKGSVDSDKPARRARRPPRPSIFTSVYTSTFRDKEAKVKPSKQSVMIRPTAKALQYKAIEHSKSLSTQLSEAADDHHDGHGPYSGDAIHDRLPREVFSAICRLVVVEESHFIYPLSTTGREQPDLVMTCKAIRTIVLSIYYGLNTFALELDRFHATSQRIPKYQRWLSAAQPWLKYIRLWVFTHESSQAVDDIRVMLLSIKLPIIGPSSITSEDKQPNSSNVGPAKVDSPIVEVHRDGRCLLPSSTFNKHCQLQHNPDWLNDIIIESFGVGNEYRGIMTASAVQKLQTMLGSNLPQLTELCCVEASSTVE